MQQLTRNKSPYLHRSACAPGLREALSRVRVVRSRQRPTTQRGFTIVELLIVIVIIGILAAIVIVAYNGIQDRAKETKTIAMANSYYKAFILMESDGTVLSSLPNACLGPTSFYASGCNMAGQAGTVQASVNSLLSQYGVRDQQASYWSQSGESPIGTVMYSPGFYGHDSLLYNLSGSATSCGSNGSVLSNPGSGWGLYGAQYSQKSSVALSCFVAID